MPKKTTYSRNTAQRAKPKQKSFELVRPVSDDNVLETVENSEELEATDVETLESEVEETPEQESSPKRVSSKAAATAAATATVTSSAPKSASARIAARRQARQGTQPKTQQRSAANMVLAENYSYVRKDLLFILILAIIMFAIIVVLHFVIGS
jgi:cobalamin biosynthesis Mg chelatase CobN